MSDSWDGAEPVVMFGEARMCNGTIVAGGAVMHTRDCPMHGRDHHREQLDQLRVEIAALTADRDALAARLERAEKVVEAAVVFARQGGGVADNRQPALLLLAAVDSYQKGTETAPDSAERSDGR